MSYTVFFGIYYSVKLHGFGVMCQPRVGLWLNYGITPAGEVLPGREVVEWMTLIK
jgi:hypothetical protein